MFKNNTERDKSHVVSKRERTHNASSKLFLVSSFKAYILMESAQQKANQTACVNKNNPSKCSEFSLAVSRDSSLTLIVNLVNIHC